MANHTDVAPELPSADVTTYFPSTDSGRKRAGTDWVGWGDCLGIRGLLFSDCHFGLRARVEAQPGEVSRLEEDCLEKDCGSMGWSMFNVSSFLHMICWSWIKSRWTFLSIQSLAANCLLQPQAHLEGDPKGGYSNAPTSHLHECGVAKFERHKVPWCEATWGLCC